MPGCDISGAVEITDRLLWASTDRIPEDTRRCHYFSVDNDLIYQPFCCDFGPLNLGMVYQFCKLVASKLEDPGLKGRQIVHVCSTDSHKRSNAAVLMGAYQVILMHRSAQVAYEPFRDIQPAFLGFRDALPRTCNFRLTPLDCLEGLEKAIELGWFDWKTFNLDAYEFMDKVENCDANWIVPEKFLAFAGPSSTSYDSEGFPNVTPEDCLPIFQSSDISLVVRLNRKDYDRRRFTDNGIRHVDLYFADGSCPSEEIISRFLTITENESGAIAVHCKAGLGRTCTLIGLYVMKHFRFPARAFIGWARICRPGSVLGPQQQFLVDMQEQMFAAGGEHYYTPPAPASLHGLHKGAPGAAEDVGQGERLCGAKRGGRTPAGENSVQPIPFNLPPSPTPSQSHSKAPAPPQQLSHPGPPSPAQVHGTPSHQRPVPLLPLAKATASSQPLRAMTTQIPPQVTNSSPTSRTMMISSVKVPSMIPQQMHQKVFMRHSVAALPLDTGRKMAGKPGPTIVRQASFSGLGGKSPPASVSVNGSPAWREHRQGELRPSIFSRTPPVSAF